jgi:1,4-dihydroxy-2-naphthoyl-CoA synthase
MPTQSPAVEPTRSNRLVQKITKRSYKRLTLSQESPAYAPIQGIGVLVVRMQAYAMFALGEPMEAPAALACGLANAVVPQGELRKKAHEAAIALTRQPAGSLSLTKKLMREHQRIATQIAEEWRLFKQRLKTPEAREAFAAFAVRRPPDFARVA